MIRRMWSCEVDRRVSEMVFSLFLIVVVLFVAMLWAASVVIG